MPGVSRLAEELAASKEWCSAVKVNTLQRKCQRKLKIQHCVKSSIFLRPPTPPTKLHFLEKFLFLSWNTNFPFLWKVTVYCHINRSPSLNIIHNQLNPVRILTRYLYRFILILLSHLIPTRSLKFSKSSSFHNKLLKIFVSKTGVLHVPSISKEAPIPCMLPQSILKALTTMCLLRRWRLLD